MPDENRGAAPATEPSRRRRSVAFALAYFVAIVAGRQTYDPVVGAAVLWPAAGVGFAWLMPYAARWTSRAALGNVAGLAAASAAGNTLTGASPGAAVAFSVSNVLAAAVAVQVYRRGRARMDVVLTRRSRLCELLLSAFAGGLAAAGAGAAYAAACGSFEPMSALHQIMRNAAGIFVIGIATLPGRQSRSQGLLRRLTRRWTVVLAIGTAVTYWFLFSACPATPLFFLVPVSVLAALVADTLETAGHSAFVSTAAILLSMHGDGPLSGMPTGTRALVAQCFAVLLCLVTMTIVLLREEQARLVAQIDHARCAADEQARLMESIVGSIGEGVVVVDADGSVVLHNQTAGRLLGERDPDPGRLGWRLDRLPSALLDTDGEGDSPLARAFRGDPGPTGDVMLAGEEEALPRIVNVVARRVDRAPGEHTVAVVRDVTSERRSTEELRRFAGVVAHDLRSPLASVTAWAEIIRDEVAHDAPIGDIAPMLAKIESSAERMGRIIEDLLTYSVSRGASLDLEDLSLRRLVLDIAEGHVGGWVGADVPQIGIDADVSVRADATALRQVLHNLVGNAIKYRIPGETARIDVTGRYDGEGRVLIEIADRGIGIPAGEEQAIFDEFHRVPGRRHVAPGTGLGLAIVRRIVERHGGAVRARRRDGGGTVFEFTLPAGTGATETTSAGAGVSAGAGTGVAEVNRRACRS